MKTLLLATLFLAFGVGGALLYLWLKPATTTTTPSAPVSTVSVSDEICPEHQVPEAICPFCDESLIDSMGHCPEHDVPEALCTRCNADLIPAFQAENDWCAGHSVPESQCTLCNHSPLNPKSDG